MRKLIVSLCACGVLLTGSACDKGWTKEYNPQSPSHEHRTVQSCAKAVVKVMGIKWTYEDGATEELDIFERKVRECLNG